MSRVLFSAALHEESVHEENIIKSRKFRFTMFFRAPDLKTDTLQPGGAYGQCIIGSSESNLHLPPTSFGTVETHESKRYFSL